MAFSTPDIQLATHLVLLGYNKPTCEIENQDRTKFVFESTAEGFIQEDIFAFFQKKQLEVSIAHVFDVYLSLASLAKATIKASK